MELDKTLKIMTQFLAMINLPHHFTFYIYLHLFAEG